MPKQTETNNRDELIELTQAYQKVFSGEAGKLVLRDLASTFDLNGSSFIAASDFNPYHAAQRDGEKRVLNHILRQSNPYPNNG